MKRVQAKKHKIGTNEIDKISLSCFDDKRQVLDDGIHTLAYFHKDSHKLQKRLCQLKKLRLSRQFYFIFFYERNFKHLKHK